VPGLKGLSGRDVIRIFERFGFQVISQKGSHVKLRRVIEGHNQNLTIPNHKLIDRGTLRAIFIQAARYIDPELLKKEFYSE